jgi:transposase
VSRCKEAPADMDCPFRHRCPHLEGMACSWVMENYQEAFELRERLGNLEQQYQQQVAALTKALLERDQKIAQLQLQHQKQFKANRKPKPRTEPIEQPPRKRGAPVGHPPWRRRQPGPADELIEVPPPQQCPHCQGRDLTPSPEVYEHTQEDIRLAVRVHTSRFLHAQCYCTQCRRNVYQAAPGEVPGCRIGPITRAVATHLRYDLQIPYRKVRHILQNLFGMPLTPASAIAFDRKATVRGRPLYEELRVKLQNSPVAHADETSWREDGQGRFLWYGGHQELAFFQITDNRAAESAVLLLGEDFGGTLITDAYAAYNAVKATARQTCWSHINTRCKELLQQIALTEPPVNVRQSVLFLRQLRTFGLDLCALGRQRRNRTLTPADARAKLPSLVKRLRRIAGKPMDYAPAETLRQRLMEKDYDKLFTFLRVEGVDPTNNLAERSVRPHVIMRKIFNGTRSPAGSESHAVLPSLLQTAQLQGKSSLEFLSALITQPLAMAHAALFANTS